MSEKLHNKAQEILSLADIQINGNRPWDIQVHDNRLYSRVFSDGSVGFGEAYMDGWWDAQALDQFFDKLLAAKINTKINPLNYTGDYLKSLLFNLQNKSRAFNIGEKHYDIGNDLYKAMLDDRMVYTCGYFKNTDDLNIAQEKKLDLVCRKIGLKEGNTVLDIGCGWGSFAKFAAEKYGAHVTGITVSKEQAELARKNCQGLPIEIHLQDYREVTDTFDHVISLGMFEHVGYKNYREYMEIARRALKDNGFFLLHTIGGNISATKTDPWLNKYIFPDSMLPSIAQIGKAAEGLFVMEDWHNFGQDYDKTLMAWFKNFDAAWPQLKNQYDERFYRMWKYYLLSCAGSFRCRMNQLWQIVLTKDGVRGGYTAVR